MLHRCLLGALCHVSYAGTKAIREASISRGCHCWAEGGGCFNFRQLKRGPPAQYPPFEPAPPCHCPLFGLPSHHAAAQNKSSLLPAAGPPPQRRCPAASRGWGLSYSQGAFCFLLLLSLEAVAVNWWLLSRLPARAPPSRLTGSAPAAPKVHIRAGSVHSPGSEAGLWEGGQGKAGARLKAAPTPLNPTRMTPATSVMAQKPSHPGPAPSSALLAADEASGTYEFGGGLARPAAKPAPPPPLESGSSVDAR